MALGTLFITQHARAHDMEIIVDCTGMTTITVKRDGHPVRGMDTVPATTPGHFYGVDVEVPNGIIIYEVTVSDGTNTAHGVSIGEEMDHGGDWIYPLGLQRDGMLVNVESLKQHTYAVDREVVNVLGRPDPVAVSYGRHWFSGSLVLLTLDDTERIAIERMLFSARILVFAARLNAGYEDVLYLSIGEVTAERTSSLAFEDSRRWTLEVQSVGAPPADYVVDAVGDSWSDVRDTGDLWGEVKLTDTWRSLMGF